jgi:hypothetical protein
VPTKKSDCAKGQGELLRHMQAVMLQTYARSFVHNAQLQLLLRRRRRQLQRRRLHDRQNRAAVVLTTVATSKTAGKAHRSEGRLPDGQRGTQRSTSGLRGAYRWPMSRCSACAQRGRTLPDHMSIRKGRTDCQTIAYKAHESRICARSQLPCRARRHRTCAPDSPSNHAPASSPHLLYASSLPQ